MTGIVATGLNWTFADAVGFLVSAQLNFALSSKFTWGDRRARLSKARWLSYNGTALISLAVNTAAFSISHTYFAPLVSAALGVLAGTVVTYLVCDRLVFRTGRRPVLHVEEKAEALT